MNNPFADRDRPSLELIARPYKLRLAGWILAALIVAFSVVQAINLRGETATGSPLTSWDQVAVLLLGGAFALAVTRLCGRAKVQADAAGVRIGNIIGGYDLPWATIRAVRYGGGTPWAQLEVINGEAVGLHAIQSVDGQRASGAITRLRELLLASRTPVDEEPDKAAAAAQGQ